MLISPYKKRVQRSTHNTKSVLLFLYDETYSSAEILGLILKQGTSGTYKTLNRLHKEGLIKRHKITEINLSLWGLSQKGLIEAWEVGAEIEQRSIFEPSKLNPLLIRHNLDLQKARINAEQQNWSQWMPEKLLPIGLPKRPDATAYNSIGEKIAIEYERTIKTKKRYEVIWSIYLREIKRGSYDRIHYVTPDDKTLRSLSRIFSLIESIPIHGDRVKIGDNHRRRFEIFTLKDCPPKD